MEYTGPEHRQASEISLVKNSIDELRREVQEQTKTQRMMAHSVNCLKTEVERYKPLLERLAQDRHEADDIRQTVKKHVATGAVWSALLALLAATWFWLQHHIGGGN